nr:hypothetical protein [Ureaplasma parvum]
MDEYANKHGYSATSKLLDQQLHISEFLLLEISNANKSTPSLKHSYKQECFTIIKKYGDIFLYRQICWFHEANIFNWRKFIKKNYWRIIN